MTPVNTAQVQHILEVAARAKQANRATDVVKLSAVLEENNVGLYELLQKVGKATIRVMANSIIYSTTNAELIEHNRR